MDFKTSEMIRLNSEDYNKYFSQTDFGFNLAKEILEKLGILEIPVRIIQGSNLVFEVGTDLFLKISPPFFEDAFKTELKVTSLFEKHFSFQFPQIIESGNFEDWKFLISKRVYGKQIFTVFRDFSFEDKSRLASDLGQMIFDIGRIKPNGFERDFGPWDYYLNQRLQNQYDIHLKRGNSEEWVKKITSFVEDQKESLVCLGPPVLVHADINHEHVMVDLVNGRWQVTGLLDLADTMVAPCEVEFILPFLDFFRGSAIFQKQLLSCSQYQNNLTGPDFSRLMLALTLQNRFMVFHDWFDREIKSGIDTLEDLADKLFPY